MAEDPPNQSQRAAAPGQADDEAQAVARFVEAFNAGRFFAAHEVLEAYWLGHRGEPDASFHQGLIQLAGAFLHLSKLRLDPALRLLRSAVQRLRAYPSTHCGLCLGPVLDQIEQDISRSGPQLMTELCSIRLSPVIHAEGRKADLPVTGSPPFTM